MLANNTATSVGLLILRTAFGCFMLVHGIQKLMSFGDMAEQFPDPIGLGSQFSLVAAIGAEVGCSLLLILGLGTRLAAIPLAFTMLVALFVVHTNDPWKVKELAAVFLSVYVFLMFTGAGEFSLDRLVFRAKKTDNSGSAMAPD